MWYDNRFRAHPDRIGVAAEVKHHIDIHRQAYNHTNHEYNIFNSGADNIVSTYYTISVSPS